MAKLLDYDKQTAKKELKGTIRSGIKSGDSNEEMMIVEPLIKHPEIDGLYRAVDPTTGWQGWVEYTPEISTNPPLTNGKRIEYVSKVGLLKRKIELFQMGIATEKELGIEQLKSEVRDLAVVLGEI